ncbi:MAG: redoxin family protein [Bryobacteraceae bacterium]
MSRALACRMLLLPLVLLEAYAAQVTDLQGNPADPLSHHGTVQVLLFLRTDCPITNRYAPELQRIASQFAHSPVAFSLVYSASVETTTAVEDHLRQYRFPGTAILDPGRALARRAHATVAPEAAVFDRAGHMVYLGRIDDRWISFGKSRPQATVHDLEAAITALLAGKMPREGRTQAIGCSLEDSQ